ncbi:amidase family protein [Pseudophaeobacter sp.]|uniref:amidase family protein n=1 Tax=Pseudophaeobacter sp. TaxID=1971739 RepID=UPI003297F8D9
MPTEYALPTEGMMANGAAPLKHFARIGPIARQPEDLGLIWEHMRGPAPEGESPAAPPKLLWSMDSGGLEVCKDISECMRTALRGWHRAGFQVAQAAPEGFDFSRARRAFGEIMGYETGALMPASSRFLARLFGRASARRSPEFLANVLQSYRHSQKRYDLALTEKHVLSAALDAFLADNAVWLLPVTAVSAFKHLQPTRDQNGVRDYADPLLINGKPVNYFDALTSFVTPISLTGHPVVTLPLGLDRNGLPVGGQLIGAKGSEAQLLRTARLLQDELQAVVCPLLAQR